MSDYFSNLKQSEQNYLALSCIKGIGVQTLRLIHCADGLDHVHQWDEQAFRQLGISLKRTQLLMAGLRNPFSKTLEQTLAWQHSADNHHIITPVSEAYPERLVHIATPPTMLMVKGQLDSLLAAQVAIVGSRHPSFQGRHEAYEFSVGLANSGVVVTSGLARGIDTQAHQGALDADAATIAVLGSGLNHIYPKENAELAEQICQKGALVSEFALHTRPSAGHFPKRNRIVSGLSLGVLVIEAHLKSGSLITARQALEQNREVFAIPGNLSNVQKSGCHYLIRQGATLVESPDQILLDLHGQIRQTQENTLLLAKDSENPRPKVSKEIPEGMQPEHYQVYRFLDQGGVAMEQLIQHTGLSVSKLNELLLDMELNMWVTNEQGLFFRQPEYGSL